VLNDVGAAALESEEVEELVGVLELVVALELGEDAALDELFEAVLEVLVAVLEGVAAESA
jgi:hypothetical protein